MKIVTSHTFIYRYKKILKHFKGPSKARHSSSNIWIGKNSKKYKS